MIERNSSKRDGCAKWLPPVVRDWLTTHPEMLTDREVDIAVEATRDTTLAILDYLEVQESEVPDMVRRIRGRLLGSEDSDEQLVGIRLISAFPFDEGGEEG